MEIQDKIEITLTFEGAQYLSKCSQELSVEHKCYFQEGQVLQLFFYELLYIFKGYSASPYTPAPFTNLIPSD